MIKHTNFNCRYNGINILTVSQGKNMLTKDIKILRNKHGLSQEQLARKAEVTYSTLVKIESGSNDNPTIKTVMKIADALGVTIDKLVR